MKKITITECPRDAMQGISTFIATEEKANYLNSLLKVGFDVLDFGSFVSPKAIPQLADTAQVLELLSLPSATQLLAIVANLRGAQQAVSYEPIHIIGFPLSISETFQQRNTGKSIDQAFEEVIAMQALCLTHHKVLRVYLSMAFGNPYGEPYSSSQVLEMAKRLSAHGITEIALADTIGTSNPSLIKELWYLVNTELPKVDLIAHLHSAPSTASEKIEAALEAGCSRFDTAFLGFGGCPMAKDELTGNLATETLIAIAKRKGYEVALNEEAYQEAMRAAQEIFATY